MGMDAEQKLYAAMGLDAELLDSGCCGLAGAFGFEHEHHDISVKIGERKLLPAVRDAPRDTLVIADGFSCKTQIEQLTDRRALHTAQVIRMAIDHGRAGPAGGEPERLYPDVEPGRVGRVPILAAAAALVAGGAALWVSSR